jgi:AcrR family transcriptional regulator
MPQLMPDAPDVTLRGRHRELTRRLIIDAFTQVILRDGIHEFSMQAVAEEAGCALRTLYRYFPNREELISGLNAELQQFIHTTLDRAEADSSTDLADLTERLVVAFQERRDLVRAGNAASLPTGLRSEISGRVRAIVEAGMERAAPTLTPREHARVYAGLRQVLTSRAWLSLTDQLSTEEAARTAGWMVRTMLADVANGGGPKVDQD